MSPSEPISYNNLKRAEKPLIHIYQYTVTTAEQYFLVNGFLWISFELVN